MGDTTDGVVRLLRAVCVVVSVVAGVAGLVMLVLPEDTDRYFSWPMGPPPLAATVGSFYLASTVLFGLAARSNDWFRVRGLCFGVLALTLPTLVFTINHEALFDFGRWQAVTWVALFVASPLTFGTILVLERGLVAPTSRTLPAWAIAVLSVLAIAYGALAVAIWWEPENVGELGPFRLVALSGRFIGCWAAFLATLAAYAAIRNRRRETLLPAVALTLWPIAGLVAAIRSLEDLAAGARQGVYLTVLVALAVGAASLLPAARESARAR